MRFVFVPRGEVAVVMQKYRIGFGELARHLGVESEEVSRLCAAGEIEHYVAPGSAGVRLITRKAANKYLKRVGLPPVAEEQADD